MDEREVIICRRVTVKVSNVREELQKGSEHCVCVGGGGLIPGFNMLQRYAERIQSLALSSEFCEVFHNNYSIFHAQGS